MGKTKSWKATSLQEKAQQKHDRGFDFREQGGRREGSCERFRVMANKEDEEKVCERWRPRTTKTKRR
uniref:Uncharacterized protein n=1 Tax=Cucumis melo TaxID=3656 RepID=A0A9I9D985_CUCME